METRGFIDQRERYTLVVDDDVVITRHFEWQECLWIQKCLGFVLVKYFLSGMHRSYIFMFMKFLSIFIHVCGYLCFKGDIDEHTMVFLSQNQKSLIMLLLWLWARATVYVSVSRGNLNAMVTLVFCYICECYSKFSIIKTLSYCTFQQYNIYVN